MEERGIRTKRVRFTTSSSCSGATRRRKKGDHQKKWPCKGEKGKSRGIVQFTGAAKGRNFVFKKNNVSYLYLKSRGIRNYPIHEGEGGWEYGAANKRRGTRFHWIEEKKGRKLKYGRGRCCMPQRGLAYVEGKGGDR